MFPSPFWWIESGDRKDLWGLHQVQAQDLKIGGWTFQSKQWPISHCRWSPTQVKRGLESLPGVKGHHSQSPSLTVLSRGCWMNGGVFLDASCSDPSTWSLWGLCGVQGRKRREPWLWSWGRAGFYIVIPCELTVDVMRPSATIW